YTLGGTVTLGNSPNFVANADATVSATLEGAANITKSGLAALSLTGTNTYSGVTIFEDGVINAASLADNGTASSLGTGTGDTDPETIGLLFQGGTLQYTGATAQSTNRSIRVGLEGATIDASGSDPSATLSFTAASSTNLFFSPGARTLTFTGTNTGDNTFAMAIGDAFGATSVVKDGAGKWILSGANTYTGSTTVNGGTLSLTSASLDNASSVVIASGAELDLDFSGNDIVGSLEINGSGPLPGGLYNSTHSTYGSFFTGTGSLLVLNGADGTWTSLVDGIWDDTANWSGGVIATGFDQTATFNQATGVTVTLDAAKTIGNLAFDVSDYTLDGSGTLTLDSSGIPAISVASGRTATISANVAGIYGMEKTGDGTLVFTGNKSYTGETTVTGGTLELQGATGGNAQIHASLTVNPGATVAFTGGDGTGFGFYNNPVSFINVDGGTINAISGTHLGFGPFMSMVMDNGALLSGSWQWNGDSLLSFSSYGDSTNTISGNIVLRPDAGTNHTFYVDDGLDATDLQIDADLVKYSSGTSALIKDGPGTMILNGTNTYNGNTEIYDGTLQVTAASSLSFLPTANGITNSVTGSSTATLSFLGTIDLDLAAADLTNGNGWTLFDLGTFTGPAPVVTPSAIISTAGTFGKSGTTWSLSSGANTWTFEESTGVLSLAVASSNDYETWGGPYGLSTGSEGGDLDNDGVTNGEEYAFGLVPNSGSSVNPIVVPFNKSTGTFSYTRRAVSLQNPLLTYSVWYSTDL
ncbi:MAG: autotransporter-associated beta strand repeat-containing protein, partial [Verrucomicrobiae bacterium]|nr:autotransporter-associated beta strand repeat-containing protein [Verrucomicrobiae bacterium]